MAFHYFCRAIHTKQANPSKVRNRCPITVLTGLSQDALLISIKTSANNVVEVRSVGDIRTAQRSKTDSVLKALDGMHNEVSNKSSKKRQVVINGHNRKTNVRATKFTTGDFFCVEIFKKRAA